GGHAAARRLIGFRAPVCADRAAAGRVCCFGAPPPPRRKRGRGGRRRGGGRGRGAGGRPPWRAPGGPAGPPTPPPASGGGCRPRASRNKGPSASSDKDGMKAGFSFAFCSTWRDERLSASAPKALP